MNEASHRATRYKTTNWPQYNAALKARGSLTFWLQRDMQWLATPSGKRGRQQTFSDTSIQFCWSIKCLFNLPLHQNLGLMQSLLELAGLDWLVPDYSIVSRRQKRLCVQQPYRHSTGGRLNLLVDSTDIKFIGEGECKRKKHGTEYRSQWRKVHLGIDANTLEVRAIEVTDNSVGDAPMLEPLLKQIPPQEALDSVTCDGAHDTQVCHKAIAQRQAQAIIVLRKNAKLYKGSTQGQEVRNEAVRASALVGVCGNQNALLQTFRRVGDGSHV